jgi:hypothetical protein
VAESSDSITVAGWKPTASQIPSVTSFTPKVAVSVVSASSVESASVESSSVESASV